MPRFTQDCNRPLANLKPADLVVLTFIVKLLGLALRDELRTPGLDDASALRGELLAREVA